MPLENCNLILDKFFMAHDEEPEIREYLWKIVYSICYGVLWLSLNVLAGMYWGYGIINGKLSIVNILFFLWFLVSLLILLRYYYRTWRK
jgi:hypothetical protein